MSRRVISAVLTLQDQSFSAGLRRANRQAGDFGRGVNVVQNKVETFKKSATKAFKEIGKGAAALGAAGVTVLGAAVSKTILEMDSSFAKLQAQTGALGTNLTALEGAAKETFVRGYGESLDEVATAIASVKQNIKDLDNGEISKVTSNAMLLANTLDSDVNEVTRGVNNTMQAFGISSEKAFDLFTAGGQRGVNFSNEMFDNVAEYAPLFGKMGYTAEEYFGILERGSKAGVYNLDYVNDVMKEFQIRVKDGSKGTATAMKGMSKSTQKVWKEFLKGNGTVADVASTVANELKGMNNQIDATQMAVSLFGTKFEDLESEAVYAMLGSTDAMKDFEGATESAAKSLEGSIGNRMKSAWRDLQVSIADVVNGSDAQGYFDKIANKAEQLVPAITSLVEDLIPEITNVVDKAFELGNTIKDNWGPIKETVIGITVAVLAFKTGMMAMSVINTVITLVKGYRAAVVAGTVAQWAFNTASAANPFGLIIAGLAGVVAGAVLLYRNWDTVTAKTKEVWGSIGGLSGGISLVLGPLGFLINAAIDLAKNWDSTKSVWENVWGAIQRSAATSINAIIGVINSMIDAINLIPFVEIKGIGKVDWGDNSPPKGLANASEVAKSSSVRNRSSSLASFAVGTNRVTSDMTANIHKDEMILPSRQADKVRAAGGNIDNIDKLIAQGGTSSNGGSTPSKSGNTFQFGDIIVQGGDGTEAAVKEFVHQVELQLANM